MNYSNLMGVWCVGWVLRRDSLDATQTPKAAVVTIATARECEELELYILKKRKK